MLTRSPLKRGLIGTARRPDPKIASKVYNLMLIDPALLALSHLSGTARRVALAPYPVAHRTHSQDLAQAGHSSDKTSHR